MDCPVLYGLSCVTLDDPLETHQVGWLEGEGGPRLELGIWEVWHHKVLSN